MSYGNLQIDTRGVLNNEAMINNYTSNSIINTSNKAIIKNLLDPNRSLHAIGFATRPCKPGQYR